MANSIPSQARCRARAYVPIGWAGDRAGPSFLDLAMVSRFSLAMNRWRTDLPASRAVAAKKETAGQSNSSFSAIRSAFG